MEAKSVTRFISERPEGGDFKSFAVKQHALQDTLQFRLEEFLKTYAFNEDQRGTVQYFLVQQCGFVRCLLNEYHEAGGEDLK